ncbi:GT2 family glycosyltransferase [Nocardia transvalensis]|uniref:GT2 family glycosyltransferase n=1 Tax=Nocardia transvalensis TaxID=37333 RepID=A0A7W9PLU4_9NOCA|nr:glycosyltransferase family 2 protein [Nocardia transvalensis]MBB5917984.1 GT2 family glycosyltransferase [Nocardia transvalensis]
MRSTREQAVVAGSVLAAIGAATAALNRLTVRQLDTAHTTVIEPVTVCVPARDEVERLPRLIADLRAQHGVSRMRVLVLDDRSTDATYEAAAAAAGGDERFTVIGADAEPAPGWTGKSAACARLAEIAGVSGASADAPAGVLVFLDADVRLRPGALAAAVGELRRTRAGLVSPWPYQRAGSIAEALVQPLLCWSWATTLPIFAANRSLRPSTAVSCGQFLVFDAAAYRAAGGHTAVAADITEDLALARALRRAGHRTVLVAGGRVARTRMYRGATDLDTGYTRWLWSAYGSAAGSAAVGAVAALAFWAPPVAALLGRGRIRRIGRIGYACAVAARLLARSLESGGMPGPADVAAALAHPVSVAAYLRLSVRSHRLHRAGALTWKGRTLPARAV